MSLGSNEMVEHNENCENCQKVQDVIDMFDYSTVTSESTVNIWGNLYKWMVNVYGDEWEEDYDVILDWDKQKEKYVIDVRRK